jgi:hypothetical protein
MTAGSAVRLLFLAAIWGGSFLFMRIGAPVLGPAWLIQFRVGIAALRSELGIPDLRRNYFRCVASQSDYESLCGRFGHGGHRGNYYGITPRSFLESGKSSRPDRPE